MTPKEYEAYVARLVRNFEFCANAKVSRNRRFPGVRQPGMYEIDVAVEMFLSEEVFFRMIVECKNHRRSVTRPVVQQLAQTRDAIGANKAAIASPTGFSKEAIEVAKALGIALWVMAEDVPTIVAMGITGPYISPYVALYRELRLEYLRMIGIDPAGDDPVRFLDASRTASVPGPSTDGDAERASRQEEMFGAVRRRCAFYRPITVGSAVPAPETEALFDPDTAQAQLAEWAVVALNENPPGDGMVEELIGHWERATGERVRADSDCDEAVAADAVERVKCGDRKGFVALLDDPSDRGLRIFA